MQCFKLFFLQSQLLEEPSLFQKRRRKAWKWIGNQPPETYSTIALLTNRSQEDGSWRPKYPVGPPSPCWDALLHSLPTTSQLCRFTVLEKEKQGKEKERHVRWFIGHYITNVSSVASVTHDSFSYILITTTSCYFTLHKASYQLLYSAGRFQLQSIGVFLSSSVSPFKGPRNLQTSEPTKTSFRVTWDPAPGDVKGYKVTFHPVEDGIDLRELLVSPYDNTVVLEELRWVLKLFPHFRHGRTNIRISC